MTLKNLSTRSTTLVYKRILKNQCCVCEITDEGSLCETCRELLANNQYHCQRCARPAQAMLTLCGECQTSTIHLDRIIAPLRYEGLCRGLIRKAKFEQQPHLLYPLIELLAEHTLQQDIELPTDWCLIPTSDESLKTRGFCQTTLIYRQLKRQLAEHMTSPIKLFPLVRTSSISAQHTRSKQERHKLSHRHFSTNNTTMPKHIVLIDDIVTTGSTLNACAETLLRSGAERVTALTLARTPE